MLQRRPSVAPPRFPPAGHEMSQGFRRRPRSQAPRAPAMRPPRDGHTRQTLFRTVPKPCVAAQMRRAKTLTELGATCAPRGARLPVGPLVVAPFRGRRRGRRCFADVGAPAQGFRRARAPGRAQPGDAGSVLAVAAQYMNCTPPPARPRTPRGPGSNGTGGNCVWCCAFGTRGAGGPGTAVAGAGAGVGVRRRRPRSADKLIEYCC